MLINVGVRISIRVLIYKCICKSNKSMCVNTSVHLYECLCDFVFKHESIYLYECVSHCTSTI